MSIYLSHYVALQQRQKIQEEKLKQIENFKYEFGGPVMNGNAELLNFVFQNTQMGVITIKQIMERNQDSQFQKQLSHQFKEYEEINREAKQMLNENGYQEEGMNSLEKIKTYLTINIQTLTDKTSAHFAEMILMGSNEGVIDIIKNIRKYPHADKKNIKFMERLQKIEEKNIEDLKAFL